MKQLHVLSFGLGHAASLPLKPELLDFYRWVSECVAGENCAWIAQNHQSIPIDNDTISNNSRLVYARFWESLEVLAQPADILIVDLTTLPHSVVRGTVMLHLAAAIVTLLSTPEKLRQSPAPEGRVVLLLPHVPPAQEAFRKFIEPHVGNGRIVLIGDDGQLAPDACVPRPFDAAQYHIRLSAVREDPYQLLQMKMVRRMGHFKWTYRSGPHGCVRYLYDGELCRTELVTLFQEHITRIYGSTPCPLVIYERGALNWLEDAVLALTTKIDCQNVEDAIAMQPSKKKDLAATPPLLIIPMVDSGDTAKNILDRLRGDGGLPKPHVLAVLTTQLTDTDKRIRDLMIGGEKYPIHCLMLVEQRRGDDEGTCPRCLQQVPHSDLAQESYAMLTTYDFWDMVDAAGWQPENPVPTGRKAMEAVPNFQRMIDQNGPWLAMKIRQRLESAPGGIPTDPIVVCPDEPASVLYTDYLRLLGRISTVIRIPRTVIDACAESADYQGLLRQWQGTDWHLQLSSASARELIVMDEFNYSGGTRAKVRRLLQQFGKRVLLYFSLVDFNPAGASDFHAPTYSLYEWQVYEAQDTGCAQS